jgi:hypothetical protein
MLFFFLLRMDSTALFVILHCRLHRTTITILSLVSHVQERPDWGVLQRCTVPSFHPEVFRTPWPSRGYCISRLVRPERRLTRGQPSVADNIAISENDDKRQEGDYSRSGSMAEMTRH